jgi:putative spermidine/putrescine transport system ATP-binding protein
MRTIASAWQAEMETPMAYLTVSDATKAYGAMRALDGVGFEVSRGEFVSLLGPSGCGKTTLLRSLAGLATLDDGRIVLGDRDITNVATYRRDIGFVFQNYALFPHMTVAENIAFGLRVRKQSASEVKRAVTDALQLVRLPHMADRKPSALSGGQQQRIALARALVTKPRLLLLDEPFGALDRQLREQMQLELRELTRRLGITAIFVTHDQGEALIMSDRVAVMNAGRIDQIAAPEDIYERPATKFVLDFVGLSNYLPGQVIGHDAQHTTVAVGDGRFRAVRTREIDAVEVGYAVRPGKIALLEPGVEAEHNCLHGSVTDAAYLGDLTHYQVDVGFGRPFLAHVVNRSGSYAPKIGAAVTLQWRPEDAVVLPHAAR